MRHLPWRKKRAEFKRYSHPDELRRSLLLSSLFVLAFETLKTRVIERPQELHSRGFDQQGIVIDEAAYQADVLARHKNRLRASLLWFQSMGAIDDSDIAVFERVRDARNEIVHEMANLVGSADLDGLLLQFQELLDLLRKIEMWWTVNIEIETNPDLYEVEIDPDSVIPGVVLHLQILLDVALGDGDDAWRWYRTMHPQAPDDVQESDANAG